MIFVSLLAEKWFNLQLSAVSLIYLRDIFSLSAVSVSAYISADFSYRFIVH